LIAARVVALDVDATLIEAEKGAHAVRNILLVTQVMASALYIR